MIRPSSSARCRRLLPASLSSKRAKICAPPFFIQEIGTDGVCTEKLIYRTPLATDALEASFSEYLDTGRFDWADGMEARYKERLRMVRRKGGRFLDVTVEGYGSGEGTSVEVIFGPKRED